VDDLIASSTLLDWTKFQAMRGEWISRFSKDVKL
jgi:putative spermidine/putrescine transport system substrate-binding protein